MELKDKLFPDRKDSPTIREALVSANQANEKVGRVLEVLADARQASRERDQGLAQQVRQLANEASDDATKKNLRKLEARLLGEDDPDEAA